jgi:hypothetical protein
MNCKKISLSLIINLFGSTQILFRNHVFAHAIQTESLLSLPPSLSFMPTQPCRDFEDKTILDSTHRNRTCLWLNQQPELNPILCHQNWTRAKENCPMTCGICNISPSKQQQQGNDCLDDDTIYFFIQDSAYGVPHTIFVVILVTIVTLSEIIRLQNYILLIRSIIHQSLLHPIHPNTVPHSWFHRPKTHRQIQLGARPFIPIQRYVLLHPLCQQWC